VQPVGQEDHVQRIAVLWGLLTLSLAIVGSVTDKPDPLRRDSSREELARLGQEYGDLQVWASAIAATADTLNSSSTEKARVLADQLARLMRPLEKDFERTTASLSTAQLETVLPLWERMAFAHAAFVMLQEEADSLGGDPDLEPGALEHLAEELSAVLDMAAEMQQRVLDRLTVPPPTPIRTI
jgi:hypothetical protein